MRSTDDEKQAQIEDLQNSQSASDAEAGAALAKLQETALAGENVFASLMDAAKHCSLGQMSHALYQVGGQYRRNM